MAPDVSFSTTSLEFLADDGSRSTDSGDYSSASSDDIYIGFSPRPRLPLAPSLSSSSISKSLPHRLPGSIVSQGPKPLPRSKSACPHPSSDYKHATNRTLPPPPPPPLPPPPPPLHPAARPISIALPQALDRHDDRQKYGFEDSYLSASDSFFSSMQEDDEAHVDGASHKSNGVQRLNEHYVELKNRWSSLLAVFNRAQSTRAQIHKLRHNKDEIDGKFMAAAEAILPKSPELHQLHQLFRTMQNAHLECQKVEQHLENIVDELRDGQEYLQSQEEPLAMGALETAYTNIKSDPGSRFDNSEDLALRGITGDRPEVIHPLYEKLREAFGELQLARELLASTRMKREAFRNRKTQPLTEETLDLLEAYGDAGKRKALQLRKMALMTEEDYEQLQDYDELEQNAKQDIETYTERVSALREECREKGVLPLSSSFQQEGFGLDLYYRDEIRLAPGPFDSNDESATLAHPVFPILLSNPTHLLHDFPQTALQSLRMALQLRLSAPLRAKQVNEAAREANMHSLLSSVESDDKSEYINRWLLHKLHHSAMEAELLWTTFRAKVKILDIDRWQRDVLHFWWRDEPIDVASVTIGDNGTDKASRSVNTGAVFISYSESGQLDGLRNWNLDDSWL